MNIIIFCFITILASFIMRAKAKLEIYKDISDLGYKFNHRNLQKLNDENDNESDIFTKIIEDYNMYIPVLNLIVAAIKEDKYYKNKESQLKQLINYGALEEMTKKEKEEYNKRKTGFHAIKMEKQRMLKLSHASLAQFSNGSTIWFDFKDDIDENDSLTDIIEIVQVEGSYKNLNLEEQKKLVYCSLVLTGDEMIKTIKSNDNNNYVENKDTKKHNQVIEEIIEVEIPIKEESKPKTRIKRQ